VNLTVGDGHLAGYVQAMESDRRLGVPVPERPETVVVDYGGPNMSKSLHVGHLRAAIIGESVKRLLRFIGHVVFGDIHMGDWGLPVGQLIVEMQRRRPDLPYFEPGFSGPYPERSPVTLDDLSDMYPEAVARCARDPEEAERARQATLDLQRGRPGYVALWRHFHDTSVAGQRRDFDALGVEFDLYWGESTVQERIEPMIRRLLEDGIARESEGALVVDVAEPGDTREVPPLLLTRSDGSYLYSTTDLATVEARVDELGAGVILYVVDARQGLHFEQVFRAARRSGIAPEGTVLEHVAFGTVNGPDGKPFKTREGGVLRLEDLIQLVAEAARRRLDEADIAGGYGEEERGRIATQVGLAALKFGDLSNHRTSNYLFDLDRFTSFEGKTGPYLQYGAVRIKSILRNAEDRGLAPGTIASTGDAAERSLMLWLVRLPEVMERAAELRAPNVLTEYAYELVGDFNRFYEANHILRQADPAIQASWLGLVDLTLRTLTLLLDLLGIEVPERM
ncbi:MAG: arginine--tRNA ligase, partial [Actinobacteria bacterium]